VTTQQATIFAILAVVMALLIWGRWRYDVIAFAALLAAVIAGVVPADRAFSGFGHPATVVSAMVWSGSRGLSNSGAVDLIVRNVTGAAKTLMSHILIMSGLGCALSAVMNNVGALALLMPVDIEAAKKAKRSAALTLMPLSFATILGGLVTLIGTPPNIIVAAFREDALGAPYAMFDFTPVGGACALAGALFVALLGWRLIPKERFGPATADSFELEGYIAEARVPEDCEIIARKIRELDDLVADYEVDIIGLVRGGKRLPGMARHAAIRKGDVLVIEAGPEDLERFVAGLKLEHAATAGAKTARLSSNDVAIMEVVVPIGARIAGRSTMALRLKYRFGVHLLGISRRGKRFRERLRHLTIEPGDVLLLQGNANELPEVVNRLGCLPLAGRGLQAVQPGRAGLCVGVFALAIALASTGVLYLPVALACAAAAMILLNIVPLREIYENVEWPVIVLLGSMIPIGVALETTGGTGLISQGILRLSAGQSPVVVIVLLMIITMTLSDVMNNTATTVVAAPIAMDLASRLGVSPDPFLMTVAVAASCAFLTPIGHKNNTLILGPGGYHFGDYWRMGLPLEILIVVVAVPMILLVWPLFPG
jgi:di/tricarboxylate transporter